MSAPFLIRPMQPDDVAEAERVTDAAYVDLEHRTHRAGAPEPQHRSDVRAQRWRQRVAHLVEHDGGGCWVAEEGRGLVGVVAALRRDLTWILSTFAVRPGEQGRGIGRQLFEAASTHGRGCLRGMLMASEDPLAVRRYRLAGFTLHPTMVLHGTVARSVLPVTEHVREGGPSDVALLDSVDRRVRDAAHGVDHTLLVGTHRLLVVDRVAGSGYAYVSPGGGPLLLAATSRRTASELLWETLAASDPAVPCGIAGVTPANEWAVDVGMAARMPLRTEGYLGLRHMRPPMPYLPSASLL